MSSEKYTPGEEDFVDSYAFEPGWNGYSDEKAAEARRGIAKIKAEAWDEARAPGAWDKTNPYRENGDNND